MLLQNLAQALVILLNQTTGPSCSPAERQGLDCVCAAASFRKSYRYHDSSYTRLLLSYKI